MRQPDFDEAVCAQTPENFRRQLRAHGIAVVVGRHQDFLHIFGRRPPVAVIVERMRQRNRVVVPRTQARIVVFPFVPQALFMQLFHWWLGTNAFIQNNLG